MGVVTNFSEVNFDLEYSSSLNNLLEDFYFPVLQKACRYDRATGFFSSGIFWALESALGNFVARGGRIRIVCSPRLSAPDRDALLAGMVDREQGLLTLGDCLRTELAEWDESFGSRAPSSLLRYLIANGIVEMKFAVPRTSDGMFHDKYGIFHDESGNIVSFSGSLNESLSGWTAYGGGNHESFHVFRSWVSSDSERVAHICSNFEYHWDEKSSFLRYYSTSQLPAVFRPRDDDLDERTAISQLIAARTNKKRGANGSARSGSGRDLQEHQRQALDNWNSNGKRGIISFVTGGGKTVTALAAVKKWFQDGGTCIIGVPSRDLLRQWRKEIDFEIGLPESVIVQVGAGSGPERWTTNLRSALESGRPAVVLTTYDSAQDPRFIYQFKRFGREVLFVADEVHELGAPGSQTILNGIEAQARLGLSATPERYGDEIGTARIFEYFGSKVEPEFGFREARKAGRLCQYTYDIHEARLSDDEQETFDRFTRMILIEIGSIKNGDGSREKLDHLRRERAKIIKQADDKTNVAVSIIRNRILDRETPDYEPHWLIYCNSIAHLRTIMSQVKSALWSKNLKALEYHSELSDGERDAVLEVFTSSGGVLFAVKCLDEGIDIPSVNGAVIVASSTNPREYVQRRGRILRATPTKPYAELHDIVTITTRGTLALTTELSRAREIATFAENRARVLSDLEYITGIPTLDVNEVDDSVESE